jgi:hypothetical protein
MSYLRLLALLALLALFPGIRVRGKIGCTHVPISTFMFRSLNPGRPYCTNVPSGLGKELSRRCDFLNQEFKRSVFDKTFRSKFLHIDCLGRLGASLQIHVTLVKCRKAVTEELEYNHDNQITHQSSSGFRGPGSLVINVECGLPAEM